MLVTYFCLPCAPNAIFWGWTHVVSALHPHFVLAMLTAEEEYTRGCM